VTFPLLEVESGLRKSDFKLLEIDGTVAGRTGGGFGGRGDDVLYFGENVARCIHIDTVWSSATNTEIVKIEKRN
jgi:hypothetical protein